MFPKAETLSRPTESLGVEVRLFQKLKFWNSLRFLSFLELISSPRTKKMMNRLPEGKGTVLSALDGVFKQYRG